MDDRLCRRFSAKLGITVASVEYRLAPEHPYPIPLEDCYSALTWLAGLPSVDPGRVAIAGASAGGGLAAALALLARDRGELTPAFQVLVYPMLDDRSSATAENPELPALEHAQQSLRVGGISRRRRPAGRRPRAPRRPERAAADVDRRGHPRPVPRRRSGLRRTVDQRGRAVPRRGRSGRLPRLRRSGGESSSVPEVFRQPVRQPARRPRPGGLIAVTSRSKRARRR